MTSDPDTRTADHDPHAAPDPAGAHSDLTDAGPTTDPIRVDPSSETHTRRAPAMDYDAILFASFGGPMGQDDVIPFLRNVTAGRGIPDERLEEVAVHYRTLDGVSPINAQNERMIAELRAELDSRGVQLPIYFGNRNWKPYESEALQSLYADGHRRVLGLVTSAYSSYSSCRQYREDFGMILHDAGLTDEVRIDKVRVYFNHPGFLDPIADGVRAAVESLAAEGFDLARTQILFSTHSIPTAMAEKSGPEETRTPGSGGWYVAQHHAACRYVHEQIADDFAQLPPWQLVYQSRSGAPHIPWLEPDINDVITDLAEAGGTDAVVVVPIGFVTDHMEVIWDLDTEAKDTAAEHQLGFRRVATPGTDPRFIAALADLVMERLDENFPRTAVTDFGMTPDLCGRNCCVGRTVRPTTSAIDSASDVLRAHQATVHEESSADRVTSADGSAERPSAPVNETR